MQLKRRLANLAQYLMIPAFVITVMIFGSTSEVHAVGASLSMSMRGAQDSAGERENPSFTAFHFFHFINQYQVGLRYGEYSQQSSTGFLSTHNTIKEMALEGRWHYKIRGQPVTVFSQVGLGLHKSQTDLKIYAAQNAEQGTWRPVYEAGAGVQIYLWHLIADVGFKLVQAEYFQRQLSTEFFLGSGFNF